MSRLLFYLVIQPLSRLPLSVLYGLSTFLYWGLFRLGGYRKGVVLGNLRRCFPDKSEAERREIANRFYRHFCDLLVESIRIFSIPRQEAAERIPVTNADILDPYVERGQSIVLTSGHYTNWEIAAVGFPPYFKHKVVGIYSPLKDPFMDRKARESRTKWGSAVISRKRINEFLDDPPYPLFALTFIADQAPSNNRHRLHWTWFLNQPTGMFRGAEKFAREYDLPVFHANLSKHGRGRYSATLVLITDRPRETEEGFITERYARLLEEHILQAPEFWLWTHRRWKREVPEGVSLDPSSCPPSLSGKEEPQ